MNEALICSQHIGFNILNTDRADGRSLFMTTFFSSATKGSRVKRQYYARLRLGLQVWAVMVCITLPVTVSLGLLPHGSSWDEVVEHHTVDPELWVVDGLWAFSCVLIFVTWVLGKREDFKPIDQRFYEQLLEGIPTDVAVFDEHHRYRYINPAALSDNSLRKFIIGKDDHEYFAHRGLGRKVPDERRRRFLEALRTKKKVEWVDIIEKNGKTAHVLRKFVPIYDSTGKLEMVYGFGADVTDLELLREKDQRLKANLLYAQRLQRSILPSESSLRDALGEMVLYYSPKEMVSGDFYWSAVQGDRTYFAVADCTGHGISGALLSIICAHALDESVKELGGGDPHELLEKCRDTVVANLSNSDDEVKDGMDIALCCIRNSELTFCGANRGLWLVRNGTLKEYNGHRQSIGLQQDPLKFERTVVDIEPHDMVYMFTDGIVDQFGGPNDRKFMRKNLRALLLDVAHLPVDVQQEMVAERLNSWRGATPQLDDICLLGLRIT